MKKTLKFLSSVLLISLLGFANCSKYSTGGNGTNGYLVSSYINGLIRTAVSGNCAISLNLGALYAGAILQGAVGNTTNFTETQYIAASGTTTTAQGYSSYAVVPYQKKYDAFLNTATGWAATDRNTALARQKAQVDSAAILGAVAVLIGGNAANSTAATQAALNALYDGFSTAEKTAMVTTTTGISNLATLGVTSVTALDATITTTTGSGLAGGIAAFGGSAAVAPAYMARSSWRNGMALMGCSRIPRSSCNLAAIATGNRAVDIKGQATVAGILINTPECRKNTSTNTSPTRFLTALFAGLDKDVVVNEAGFTYQNQTLQPDRITQTSLASVYGATEGGVTQATSWASSIAATSLGQPIISSKAYPKSSALASLGFASAFPLASGATAYPVTAGTAVPTSQTVETDATADAAAPNIPWYGGANINLTPVASCEALGMGSVGPTPITGAVTTTTTTLPSGTLPAMTTATVDTSTTAASRKPLSDVREILYAFSSQNTAASTYASLNGVAYTNATGGVLPVTTIGAGTQGYTDAVACNTALRKNLPISSALGVGTSLPVISTASGDGSASTLLTACIYGGTATTRTAAASVLTTSLLNITSCPTAAAAGAATFGEYGLQSLSTATTPNAIDGKP